MSSFRVHRAYASLGLLVAACTHPGPVAEDASSPDAGDAAEHPLVEIGTRASGAVFTPWHDGDTIPLVWGPQGGVMVTPAVAIDGTLVSATDPALDVVISNLTVPARAPLADFPGYGPVHALFARLDTRLVNGPIYDQLGWTETPGIHLIVQAHVSGMGIDAWGEVEIVLASSGTTPADSGAFDGPDGGGVDASP